MPYLIKGQMYKSKKCVQNIPYFLVLCRKNGQEITSNCLRQLWCDT